MPHTQRNRYVGLKVTALVALIAVGHFLQKNAMTSHAMVETTEPLTNLG